MLSSVAEVMCDVALLCFVCCIGIKSPQRCCSDMLWLLMLFAISPCDAVCTVCFGNNDSCGGDAATCPWGTVVGSNVAAVTGAVGAAITLEKLLPTKYLRLFTKPVLNAHGAGAGVCA